ncbi:MAG: putative toxin-antitoxin system toxin component, PIN family [Nitrospiria bacterium]
MRVILDTNILIGALIMPDGPPAMLYDAWKDGRFSLITSKIQLDELARATRYSRVKSLITPAEAGSTVNQIRSLATVLLRLPRARISADPDDNFLFAMAKESHADYLVTGDKLGVLLVKRYERTKIVTARQMVTILER